MRTAWGVFIEAQKWEDSCWTGLTRQEGFYWGPAHHLQPLFFYSQLFTTSACPICSISAIWSSVHLYEHNCRKPKIFDWYHHPRLLAAASASALSPSSPSPEEGDQSDLSKQKLTCHPRLNPVLCLPYSKSQPLSLVHKAQNVLVTPITPPASGPSLLDSPQFLSLPTPSHLGTFQDWLPLLTFSPKPTSHPFPFPS